MLLGYQENIPIWDHISIDMSSDVSVDMTIMTHLWRMTFCAKKDWDVDLLGPGRVLFGHGTMDDQTRLADVAQPFEWLEGATSCLDSMKIPVLDCTSRYHCFINQWIGLRENLQETIDFPIKYGAFL